MHSTLYDISIEYAALVQELRDNEGELTPELEYALLINKENLEKKAEAYALRILEFEAQAAVAKAEADRLTKRSQSYKKTADKLKSLIKSAMEQFEVPKIETERVTLSFRKSETVQVPEDFADSVLRYCKVDIVLDQDKIDEAKKEAEDAGADVPVFPHEELLEVFVLKVEASNAKIKEALKEGKSVGDCMILTNKNLQIK